MVMPYDVYIDPFYFYAIQDYKLSPRILTKESPLTLHHLKGFYTWFQSYFF